MDQNVVAEKIQMTEAEPGYVSGMTSNHVFRKSFTGKGHGIDSNAKKYNSASWNQFIKKVTGAVTSREQFNNRRK